MSSFFTQRQFRAIADALGDCVETLSIVPTGRRQSKVVLMMSHVARRGFRPVPPTRRQCREHESAGLEHQLFCPREAGTIPIATLTVLS